LFSNNCYFFTKKTVLQSTSLKIGEQLEKLKK